jgi:energy-coupling factor transporter ATP-binding protein EcfA2
VRLLRVFLADQRRLEFEAGPFTVLFGKNNAGKTNILEGVYGIFEPSDQRAVRAKRNIPGNPRYGYARPPYGDVYVELEQDVPFDDQVYALICSKTTTPSPRRIAFTEDGLLPGDPGKYVDEHGWPSREHPARMATVAGPSPHVLFLDWDFKDLHHRVDDAIAILATDISIGMRAAGIAPDWPWLQRVELKRRTEVEILGDRTQLERESEVYRVHPWVQRLLNQLASLATDLLPDFVEGPIRAEVIEPKHWGISPKVGLYYGDYGKLCRSRCGWPRRGTVGGRSVANSAAPHGGIPRHHEVA